MTVTQTAYGAIWIERPYFFDVQRTPGGYLLTFDEISYEGQRVPYAHRPKFTALGSIKVSKGEVHRLRNNQYFVSEDAEDVIMGFSFFGPEIPPTEINISEFIANHMSDEHPF